MSRNYIAPQLDSKSFALIDLTLETFNFVICYFANKIYFKNIRKRASLREFLIFMLFMQFLILYTRSRGRFQRLRFIFYFLPTFPACSRRRDRRAHQETRHARLCNSRNRDSLSSVTQSRASHWDVK